MTDRDVGRVAQRYVDQWGLRVAGPSRERPGSLVVPVLTAEGGEAMLKVSSDGDGNEFEHLVLRRWAGDGAARLLRADPRERAVLVERLRGQSLQSVPVTEACAVVSGLYGRLHVAAMPQLPTVALDVLQRSDTLAKLPRSAPIPHRLVEQVVVLSRDVTSDAGADVVLHGNLHYGTVLGAERTPWLAIAPRPANGDPHYELAPMLWHRWDDLGAGIRDGLRHRFFALVDGAGLDEDRARAWTLIRVVHAWVREIDRRAPSADALTRYAAIAKAVQD